MKSHRCSPALLALTLPALSLALLSSEPVHAASIVKCETWIGQLPAPKGLNAGAVKLKRAAVNHWVRFETPAVARRGTLTLSSGTLQFMKGNALEFANVPLTGVLVEPLSLTDVEISGSPIIHIEVASVDNWSAGAFTSANSDLLRATAGFDQLPFEQSLAADLVASENVGSALTPNSLSTVASSAAETASAEPAAVPVPEPSVAALSALVVAGLLAKRRRR